MSGWIHLANFVCLILFVDAISGSSRRVRSFAYAVAGVLLVLALGLVAMYILVPHFGGPALVNPTLDMIGWAVTFTAPIAAVYGAFRPARRVKA
jgi:hypothetical protein